MTYLIKKSIDNVVVEGISEIGKAFMEGSKEGWKEGGVRESPNVGIAGPNEQACSGLLKTRFGDSMSDKPLLTLSNLCSKTALEWQPDLASLL